jgi:hypothetical protein
LRIRSGPLHRTHTFSDYELILIVSFESRSGANYRRTWFVRRVLRADDRMIRPGWLRRPPAVMSANLTYPAKESNLLAAFQPPETAALIALTAVRSAEAADRIIHSERDIGMSAGAAQEVRARAGD